MAAGLPVIASNFELWKSIVEESHCGVCVDPYDNDQVTKAIKTFLNDRTLAQKMGQNGREWVLNKYNWNSEEKKLLSLYSEI